MGAYRKGQQLPSPGMLKGLADIVIHLMLIKCAKHGDFNIIYIILCGISPDPYTAQEVWCSPRPYSIGTAALRASLETFGLCRLSPMLTPYAKFSVGVHG